MSSRRRRKGQRIRVSYIWAGIMTAGALAALFAAIWVVITVYEKIAGDSTEWAASSAEETSEIVIDEDPVYGWVSDSQGSRYLNEDGSYAANQWMVWEGNLYYLKEDGYMATEEISQEGQIFSFDEQGALEDIQLDSRWTGLTGEDNLQNLDSLVKSNEFWCYLSSDPAYSGSFKPIYYRKTTETEGEPLGGAENLQLSTKNSLQIHDGYIYYLPQVSSQEMESLSEEERQLCNHLFRMKPGDDKKELLAEDATGYLVLEDGSVYYASNGEIQKASGGEVYSLGEQYRVQVKNNACYLVDSLGEPVSGDENGRQTIGDRLYTLASDGKITGVYPAERKIEGATFALEKDPENSGAMALYRKQGGREQVIAQSDYGINSFCIVQGKIYYSAYVQRGEDGTRYSVICRINPDGTGKEQISKMFQGNILNLYYYSDQGKIYGEYTPVSWKNCYGQIVEIDLDGKVNVIDDSASRGSQVMNSNDLLSLVMVEGNTITTYLRSCQYNRNAGSWSVLSEKPYQFSDLIQYEALAGGTDSFAGEDESQEETESSQQETEASQAASATQAPPQTQAASATRAPQTQAAPATQAPPQTQAAPATQAPPQTQAAPPSQVPTVSPGPGGESEIQSGPGYSQPAAGPEAVPTIEANPESGNGGPSGSVEFIGPS
ncbi:MAG TPA: DUF5050 domain-containing protein [Candidatus Cottocaccamicrobium excrementipullorum]|nr:DUF5050 domain-containing protein [Candidatus Cottocaccamicrobium excrementipullorum]